MGRTGGNKKAKTSEGTSNTRVEDPDSDLLIAPQAKYEPGDLKFANLHPLLQFDRHWKNYRDAQDKLALIKDRAVEVPKVIHWEPLNAISIGDRIRTCLTQRQDGRDFSDWVRLFNITKTVYREWVIEMLASVEINEEVGNWEDESFLRFSLGKVRRRLSMKQLAEALGLYTAEELATDECKRLVENGAMIYSGFAQDKRARTVAWARLSDATYKTSGTSYLKLKELEMRVIHRFIGNSLVQRREGLDKVNLWDLWYLYAIRKPDENVSIPYCVGFYLAKHAHGARGDSKIGGGCYITLIGEYLKVDRRAGNRTLSIVPPTGEFIDLKFYSKAQVVKKDSWGHYVSVPVSTGGGEEDAGDGEDEEMPEAQPQNEQGQSSGSGSFPGFEKMKKYLERNFEDLNDHIVESQGVITDRIDGLQESMNEYSYYQRGLQAQQDWNFHQYSLQRRFIPEYSSSGFRETAYPQVPPYAPGMSYPPPYDPVQAFIAAYGYHPDQQPPCD